MKKNNTECVRDCRRKNYDLIQVPFPKGEREKIKAYCQAKGLTMNEFIRNAVRSAMREDSAGSPPPSPI